MTTGHVAIIGMAVRVPGAPDVETLWRNLVDEVESISWFTPDELEPSAFLPVDPADPDFVPAAGVIDDADCFDARFFGISPADTWTYLAIAALLAVTTVLATLVPSSAAARTDPVRAIKGD